MLEEIFLKNFLIALALGALIGLEREYARYKKHAHDYAGIRTFPLIALFGAISAYLGNQLSIWILISSMLLIGALVIISYLSISKNKKNFQGATSEVAGFLTFFIGVLSYFNQIKFATAATVIITIILYLRSGLHKFAKKIKKQEMADTLKFAVIAFVILPFLPNKGFGPYEIFNPYITWLMVVFISGISFFGYILLKWFGERGITLAGILGGLVSSTAVTSSFAERSKKEISIYKALVLGVILANGIMFIRILIEVIVINSKLFNLLLIPLSVLALLTAGFSYFLWKHAKGTEGKINHSSPFTIIPALKFAAFFAVILALVKLGNIFFSESGVYIVSLISGFADVDAITLSLSQLSKGTLALETARNGIMIAALTNVGVKGGIAYLFGGKKFGRTIMLFYLALIIIGIAIIYFL